MTGGGNDIMKAIAPYNPTVWNGERMRPYFNAGEIRDSQVQPNGIDLTVDKIFRQIGNSSISRNPEYIDKGQLMIIPPLLYEGLEEKGWFIDSGYYVVEWGETIKIPDTAIGLISSRSTLLRTGGWIVGAVWDKGYFGKGRSGLNLFNPMLIERGVRLAQIIFIDAQKGDVYDGQYQRENLEENTK